MSRVSAPVPSEMHDADRAPWVIDVRDVYKRHGSTPALNGLSLRVARGSVCALLGVNGSGKTTLLKLLLGMCRPDRGEAHVLGHRSDHEADSIAIRQRSGFVAEMKEIVPQVTVRTCIDLTKAWYPRWRTALEQRLLVEYKLPVSQRVSTLSKGMRAKLALLLACCRGVELLLLDEPTDGLDPMSAEQMLQSLVGLVADEGVTVLLSSHQLHEVERVADTVAIMHNGRVVLQGALDELRETVRRIELVSTRTILPSQLPDGVELLACTGDASCQSLLVRGVWDGDGERAGAVLAAACDAATAHIYTVGLREMFLAVTRVATESASPSTSSTPPSMWGRR